VKNSAAADAAGAPHDSIRNGWDGRLHVSENTTFVCSFGTALVAATFFVAKHVN
jgi:hypothetical protein